MLCFSLTRSNRKLKNISQRNVWENILDELDAEIPLGTVGMMTKSTVQCPGARIPSFHDAQGSNKAQNKYLNYPFLWITPC